MLDLLISLRRSYSATPRSVRVLVVCVLFPLCSCTAKLTPLFPGTEHLVPASSSQAAQLGDFLDSRCDDIGAFRGLVKATASREGRKQSSRMAVVFARPAKLRLEVLTPGLNQPALLITADDGRLRVYDPRERALYSGSDSGANISRFIGVPLNVSELMYWLTARASFCSSRPWTVVETRASGNGVYFVHEVVDTGGRRIRFGVDASLPDDAGRRRFLMRFMEVREKGGKVWLGTAYAYNADISEDAPASLLFQIPGDGVEGRLDILKADVFQSADAVSDKVFAVRFPENLKRIELD